LAVLLQFWEEVVFCVCLSNGVEGSEERCLLWEVFVAA
jgi:hypothetical protein